MTEHTKISDTFKWIAGVLITVIMAVTSYSINKNLDNEARISVIETQLSQVRSEVKNIWKMINENTRNKEPYIERLIILEQNQKVIEKHLEELK